MASLSLAIILVSVGVTTILMAAAESPLAPGGLRCEFLTQPLGLDVAEPRLSWVLQSSDAAARGEAQTGYRILVASTAARLARDEGDLWDSGRAESDRSIHVVYAGKPLASHARCHWKVRTWDQDGRASAWSPAALWTMGILRPEEWRAKWIGLDGGDEAPKDDEFRRLPARHLRHEFTVGRKVRQATASISGLGLYELYLNGRRVGDHVLAPALSEYSKRVFYDTFDVTDALAQGKNALGVVLGNGRWYAMRVKVPTEMNNYGYPKLILQLRIEYEDGAVEEVVSDEAWRVTAAGPIRANNEYDGEEYDARREMPGWDRAGFDDAGWPKAQLVAPPQGALAAPQAEPIKAGEVLKPLAVTQPKPGAFIFDMGQNLVGWCRLAVRGPKGTTITLRHAETLRPDGTLYLDNIRSARVTDRYTLKGEGTEAWEPRFTYHGFRYVEVTGWPGEPKLSDIQGCAVHDAVREAGGFECSSDLLNTLHRNIAWGLRGNYRSVPTDCPQRDERQGWLGDRGAEERGETYLFDIAALYANWMRHIQDCQAPSGSIPDVCPSYWPSIRSDSVTWPGLYPIVLGALYDQYGDRRVLESHYPSARKWVDFMAGFLKDGLIARDGYGDWCVPPEKQELIHSNDPARKTPGEVLATTYYYHILQEMGRYAAILGKADDARDWAARAETLKDAFNRRCFNEAGGFYGNGSQTSQVLPLAFGMAPEARRERVVRHLLDKIERESKGHVGTGLVGTAWLMRTLSDAGHADVACEIATQTTYPSWGYMASKGATTVWELWNGDTADPAMNSGNHLMLIGDLAIWMHEYLGGIRPDPERPGFKHVILRPVPTGNLRWAKTAYESMHGRIESAWKIEGGTFVWSILVPPNATATVYVPTKDPAAVTEGGKPAAEAAGVKFLRAEAGAAAFEVGSGRYTFASPM